MALSVLWRHAALAGAPPQIPKPIRQRRGSELDHIVYEMPRTGTSNNSSAPRERAVLTEPVPLSVANPNLDGESLRL